MDVDAKEPPQVSSDKDDCHIAELENLVVCPGGLHIRSMPFHLDVIKLVML